MDGAAEVGAEGMTVQPAVVNAASCSGVANVLRADVIVDTIRICRLLPSRAAEMRRSIDMAEDEEMSDLGAEILTAESTVSPTASGQQGLARRLSHPDGVP